MISWAGFLISSHFFYATLYRIKISLDFINSIFRLVKVVLGLGGQRETALSCLVIGVCIG
jgi:hypothetical protein